MHAHAFSSPREKGRTAAAALASAALLSLVVLVGLGVLTAPPARSDVVPDRAIVLRGTIVTPAGVLKHGYVGIANGRIVSVSGKQPELPGAIEVNTTGIILPGFVDLHNHVAWNALPRWKPGRVFTNRDQWVADPEYLRVVADPFDRASTLSFCDMNAWGELRALIGGVTAIMATQRESCIHGLVRNLDFNSGFYGTTELNREHIRNVLLLPAPVPPEGRTAFVTQARFFINNPAFEALSIHLSEGTDSVAEEQFTFMESQQLLNPKGVLIHGVSLVPHDFQAMAATGTALVWSPRSNTELYGATADVSAALDAGVEVALAPDWAISGSGNMLDELKMASQWNRDHLGGRLTDRQLVEMTTSTPARIVGIDDEVGAIQAGLRADILVLGGDHNDPYAAVVRAGARDVQLVLIGGVPFYGDRELMSWFWNPGDLEEVSLPGGAKTLATPAAGIVVSELAARLGSALQAAGTTLAPLVEQ